MSTTDWQQMARTILRSLKTYGVTEEIEYKLAIGSIESLMNTLATDNERKTFWINIYNAFFQILTIHEQIPKPDIFRKPLVNIARMQFSLDEIEHGILRKYRYKSTLGFLPHPFVRKIVKKLAVSTIDYRIHFALNCGAASCPPIAFYDVDKIDQQLELATLSFIESETTVLADKREIRVSRLMLWYLADFGGYHGIRKILHEKLGIETRGLKIIFKPYNWTEDLYNFAEKATV